ncbi:kinase-like domain-containing protein [Cyathus striatus]|nr:kinase-like domain-containing protein [Cyathus striatus]
MKAIKGRGNNAQFSCKYLHIEQYMNLPFSAPSTPSTALLYNEYPFIIMERCFQPLDIEYLMDYREGGFHPIDIGDTISDRYRIINKLGYGVWSTVWLAEDLTFGRFVSLKVLSSDASLFSNDLIVAYILLRAQQARPGNHPGKDHVVQIFDVFLIRGPSGIHQCIVTEILGPALAENLECIFGKDKTHLPPNLAKKVAAQIALGVAYLHECGIAHGDLHFGNVTFYTRELQHASLPELMEIYGEPVVKPLTNGSSFGPYPSEAVLVPPASGPLKLCFSSKGEVHIKICDFGESSFYTSQAAFQLPTLHIPRVFAAPEVIFGDTFSATPAMDIWALAVLLYATLNNNWVPFTTVFGSEKEVILEIALFFGKFPEKWWTRWAERARYFDEDGKCLLRDSSPRLLGIKPNSDRFSEEEADIFNNLLRKMFRYDEQDRVGADEVARVLADLWLPEVSNFLRDRVKVHIEEENDGTDELMRILANIWVSSPSSLQKGRAWKPDRHGFGSRVPPFLERHAHALRIQIH